MALEFAIKAPKLGIWGGCGGRIPADRVRAAEIFTVGPERVTIWGRSKSGGASLRQQYVACSDSAQAPPQPKRKKRVQGEGPTKTELKLLKDLQEFIASCDLPPNEVPTTAELARNGRQDLAKRVRRKGYTVVSQLLELVRITETGEDIQSEDVEVPPNAPAVRKVSRNDAVELPSAKQDDTVSNDVKEPNAVGTSNGGGLDESPLSPGLATKRSNVNGHASHKEEVVGEVPGDKLAVVPEATREHRTKAEAAGLTSKEEFTEDGNQESGRGDHRDTSELVDLPQVITEKVEADGSAEDESETTDTDDDIEEDDEYYESDGENDKDVKIAVSPDPESLSPEDIASQKAALLRAKLLQYFDSRSGELKQPNSLAANSDTVDKKVATQQDQMQTVPGDVELEASRNFETKKELEQLKGLLHSRELELSEVSRQLEEAKGMLSLARAKATAELVHVKQLAAEQDVRLQAAQQALSELKQVHLEWWGEASHVEVAGSFNGWQHKILLEPDFSSEIPKPGGARGPMMWGTYLCLYSGVYEMKFIVDGNWQVDSRREVVMRHSNQNNILRVE